MVVEYTIPIKITDKASGLLIIKEKQLEKIEKAKYGETVVLRVEIVKGWFT
jgi:hypothetical protein